MASRCLITGCCGLIGSHLIRYLQQDHELFLCGRNLNRIAGSLNGDRHQLMEGDLRDERFYSTFPKSIDHIVHLAQSEHFRSFPEKAAEVFDVNVLSTARLLEYAHSSGAKSLILASSGLVYGQENKVHAEEDPLILGSVGDLGFYYATKLCVESLAKSYSSHLPVIVLRFFFVYGPGQHKSMLFPRLIQRVMEGEPIQIQGETGLAINPIYVEDAVAAVASAMKLTTSEIINVAGNEILSLKTIGFLIGELLNKTPVFQYNSNGNQPRFVADTNKMTRLLGLPQHTFKQGIATSIRSLQETG
jgi:UDP-glucose 4-epimerase